MTPTTLKPYNPNAVVTEVTDYAGLLTRLGARDRAAVEKHMAVCEAEPTPEHAALWKRLACLLCNLAPKAMQASGQKALQFFAADGKYRRQIFAMEDLRDGIIAIYMVDVLPAARKARILREAISKTGEAMVDLADGAAVASLNMQALTSANTTGAPEYFRHMVGWNRAVLKVMLKTTATSAQIEALESLCAIAGRLGIVPATSAGHAIV